MLLGQYVVATMLFSVKVLLVAQSKQHVASEWKMLNSLATCCPEHQRLPRRRPAEEEHECLKPIHCCDTKIMSPFTKYCRTEAQGSLVHSSWNIWWYVQYVPYADCLEIQSFTHNLCFFSILYHFIPLCH